MNKDVFLVLVLISVAIAVVFLVLRTTWRAGLNAVSTSTRTQMEGLLASRTDFVPTHTSYSKTASSLLAIDEESLQVTHYFLQGAQVFVRTIRIASLLGVQLLVDEQTSVTGIGSAVGDSAIGIGRAFVHADVRSISLHFLLNDTQTPTFTYEFLSSAGYGKFESESGYVREAIGEATRIKAVLDILMHRAHLVALNALRNEA